jgi:TRAP-type transport system periplasmic protein
MTTAIRTFWVLAPAVALVAAGCSDEGTEVAEDAEVQVAERTIRLATISTTEDPEHAGAERFAEIVEDKTGGAVTVEVFPDSQLGDFPDLFADMQAGELDMFYEGISIYPTVDGGGDFLVTSVPFMWEDYEQFRTVLASERFQELFEQAAADTGVRAVVAAGDAEPRALSANRPVEDASDMEGLSLRIAEAEMPQEFAVALGAQPEVIPLSDLYLSLQQGVVDAQENGAISMVTQSFYEVQDYYMPIDYIRDVETFYASEMVWQDMEPELQELLVEAGEEAGEATTAQVAEQLEEALDTLGEDMEIVEDVDVQSFRDELEGTFEQFDGELWQEGLLTETRDLADEAR